MSASTIIVTRSSKRRAGLPAEHGLRLGRVADEQVDLGRAHELLVDGDVVLPAQADVLEGDLAERAAPSASRPVAIT